jgi:hypothetical protein
MTHPVTTLYGNTVAYLLNHRPEIEKFRDLGRKLGISQFF